MAALALSRQVSTLHQTPVTDIKWSGEQCGLCLNEFEEGDRVIKLNECKGHYFHKDCELGTTIGQYIEQKKKCPVCAYFYGLVLGDMPRGTMTVTKSAAHLPGHPTCGQIYIEFQFPGGTQGPEHYQPGRPYSSDHRVAYLPDNKDGNDVLCMYQQAWDQRMLFTVGYSLTRQQHGVVIYNGIHMKTSASGGQHSHGWPDETYFDRVKDECAAKGIYPPGAAPRA